MRRLAFLFVTGVFCLSSATLYAADIPSVDEGSSDYDSTTCIDEYSQNCINNTCLTSEELDCQQTCRKMAVDKCEQERFE